MAAVKKKVIVRNELGMHARPASKIAQIAAEATAEVWLAVNSTKVDATSIIDILTLGAIKGTEVIIEIENETDIEMLAKIADFFEDGFGEQ